MYVLKKKVIIFFIALITFFVGTIMGIQSKYDEAVLDIAIISPPTLQYETSMAEIVTRNISNIVINMNSNLKVDNGISKITSTNYQIKDDKVKETELKKVVSENDLIFLVGSQFNDVIDPMIRLNDEKQFVMINNTKTFEYNNVASISLDYEKIINYFQLNNNEKYLFIVSSENFNENEVLSIGENLFNKNSLAFVDTNGKNTADIEKEVRDYVNDGYTKIISVSVMYFENIVKLINTINDEIRLYNEDQMQQKEIFDIEKEFQESINSDEQEPINSNGQESNGSDEQELNNEFKLDIHPYIELYIIGDEKTIENENIHYYIIDYTEPISEIMTVYLEGDLTNKQYV